MSATDQRPEVSGANARRHRMGDLSRTPVALPGAGDAPASPHTTLHAQPGEPGRSSHGYHMSNPDHQHGDIRRTIDSAAAIPRVKPVPSGTRRFTDRDRPFPMTFAKITWRGRRARQENIGRGGPSLLHRPQSHAWHRLVYFHSLLQKLPTPCRRHPKRVLFLPHTGHSIDNRR